MVAGPEGPKEVDLSNWVLCEWGYMHPPLYKGGGTRYDPYRMDDSYDPPLGQCKKNKKRWRTKKKRTLKKTPTWIPMDGVEDTSQQNGQIAISSISLS